MTRATRRRLGAALLLVSLTACAGEAGWSGWKALERRFGDAPETPELVLVEDPPAALPAPEGLRADSGEYRAIPLKWDPLLTGDVGGYLIEWSASGEGPFERLAAVRGRGHFAYLDGDAANGVALGDGESRFYRLRAFTTDARLSQESSPVVTATTAALPEAPLSLRAYSTQPREVPLSWSASEDPIVSGYTVERSPSRDGPWEVVAEPDGRRATTYIDRDLGDLRVFYYRVSARNPGGARGPASRPMRAVTKPRPLPPIGLRVAEQGLGRNVLEWVTNVEPDITEYRLLRARGDDAPETVTAVPAEQTRAEDPGVEAGELVSYALVAIDRDGLESDPSYWVTVESESYELTARVEPDGVLLEWNPRTEEGFSAARLERTTWLAGARSARVEAGRFLDRDVSPGRTYRYVATLLRSDQSEAPASRPVEVTVPEEPSVR